MELVFLLVGLVFVAFGLLVLYSEGQARRGALEVPGEVIGLSTGQGASSGASYHCVAAYGGTDGRRRYVEASVGSSSPLGAVGDPVTVLVQPDDPERATIKSALTSVVGAALALMGLASCIVFFAVFRLSAISIAGAVAVVGVAAYKLGNSVRDKPMSLQAWRDYKKAVLRPRVFTDETKGEIRWADPAALQTALLNQQKTSRVAIPLLLLAGAGLLVLGVHLHGKTELFLATAVRAPGVVVEMATNDSSDGDTYAPVVEFEHEGSKYRFKDSISSNPPTYRRGQRVDVLYDPVRPRNARIDRGLWNKVVPILIGGFGALLCLLGLWSLKRRASGKTW
jgi:hypothetical protein